MVEEPRPARRKAAPAKKASARFTFLSGKPLRILALVVAAGVLVGIGLNATLFQTARHPAPFFAAEKQAQTQPQKPVAPTPAPRPADLGASEAKKPAAAQQQARAADPARKGDQIGALLRGEPAADAQRKSDPIAALLRGEEGPSPQAKEQQATARVAAAQRALQKVGYVVKPDGVFGSTTRVALEKFERDRGLPVTGQLSGRTVKQLAAQSGVAIP